MSVPRPTSPADVISLFTRTFGTKPQVVASAPGRVNLIGEHTDYNGGEVLPIAIAQRTWIAVRESRHDDRSRAISANTAAVGEWDFASPRPAGEWWDYLSGVACALVDHGVPCRPLDIAVVSDVPLGAGLSSSAALEVAMAVAVAGLYDADLPLRDVALLSQRAERDFVGVACGLMDQHASALSRRGHALHLHCDTGATEHVPMNEAVLVFDTGIPRSLRNSDFNTRRQECEQAFVLLRRDNPNIESLADASPDEIKAAHLPAPLDRRALHVSEETRRVQQTVETLRTTGVLPGEMLNRSHDSLRVLYECSTPELDWFVERASSAPGVSGARLTGAGWGGCAIAVGRSDDLSELAAGIADEYRSRFGATPRTWITRAEDGARLDSVSP